MRYWLIAVVLWIPAVAASLALAADVGSSEDRGRSADEAQQHLRRAEFFLQELDKNHNGVLEADEVSGRGQYYVERMLHRAGLEANYPLSIDRVKEGLTKYYQAPAPGTAPASSTPAATPSSSTSSGSSGSAASPASASGVPGFGAAKSLPPVPGFGVTGAMTGAAAVVAGGVMYAGGGSPASPDEISRYRDYAQKLVGQYDKNHNGTLEQDEWSQMSKDPSAADTNHNGSITVDELTAWYLHSIGKSMGGGSPAPQAAPAPASSGPSTAAPAAGLWGGPRGGPPPGGPGPSGGNGGGKGPGKPSAGSDAASKHSIRMRTATERLPSGLPDWFTSKDTNADGQVSMFEFSQDWSASRVTEFEKYDLNHDGVITPEECLQADKKKTSGSDSGKDNGKGGAKSDKSDKSEPSKSDSHRRSDGSRRGPF